jgi:predicted kinase
MKFIQINGPSCVGKSTIVKHIIDEKPRYYKVSYDALKWGFSQYKADEHFDDVRALVRGLAEAVCKIEYNIVCDSGMHLATREQLFEIARRHNYEVIEINLEADYEVLRQRFEARMANAAADPSRRISNKNPERHRELFDIYQAEKNPNAITFRTDLLSEDEIAKQVLALA